MGDNNLDDLIIGEPEEKGKKQKGLFVILGLVILLLIFGVVLANMIFGESSEDKKVNTDTVKNEKIVMSDDLKKVEDNTKNNDEDPDLAPLDEEDTGDKQTSLKTNNFDIEKTEQKVENKKVEIEKVNELDKTINKPVVQQEKKKPIIEPKPLEHKKTHVVKKQNKAPETKKSHFSGTGNRYIQVGSFSKGPDQNFINKIRRAGLKYKIVEYNGYRRVLVGPFNSKEVNSALKVVKSKISPNAFLKR